MLHLLRLLLQQVLILQSFQLLCILDRADEISPELVNKFPEDNIILRDVDGLPIYIEHFKELEIGQPFLNSTEHVSNS